MHLPVSHLSVFISLFLLLLPSIGLSWPAKVVSVSDADTIATHPGC